MSRGTISPKKRRRLHQEQLYPEQQWMSRSSHHFVRQDPSFTKGVIVHETVHHHGHHVIQPIIEKESPYFHIIHAFFEGKLTDDEFALPLPENKDQLQTSTAVSMH